MRKVKIVVNDFHIGKGPILKDGTINILEDFRFGKRFVEFLEYYRKGEFEAAKVELIINGDFLNLLQIDYMGVHTYMITEKMVVHAIRAIITGHPEVFAALREFAEAPFHEIAYVIGNHDIGLCFDNPRKVLLESIGPKLRFYDTYYEFDGIRVEHGHQYDGPNTTNPQRFSIHHPDYPEPVLNLPWGSFFAAVFLPKIKKERPFVDKVKPFMGYIRWALLHDTFFALKTAVFIGISFARMRALSNNNPVFDLKFSFRKIRDFFIYPSFMKEARKVIRKNPHLNAVIFGHTHVLKYKQWGGGKEYFNTGTWNEVTSLDIADFGLQNILTYGFIEIPPKGSGHRARIRLKEWKGMWTPEEDTSLMPVGK